MPIPSRIKKFIEISSISPSQFADVCGIPRPTLSQILSGRNKKISDEIISKIHSAYPDLSIVWLLFGEGSMQIMQNNQSKTNDPIADLPQQIVSASSTNNSIENNYSPSTAPTNQSQILFSAPLDKFDNSAPSQPAHITDNIIENSQPSTNESNRLFPSSIGDDVKKNISNQSDSIETEGNNSTISSMSSKTTKKTQVEKIAIFYSDGSFKLYFPDKASESDVQ